MPNQPMNRQPNRSGVERKAPTFLPTMTFFMPPSHLRGRGIGLGASSSSSSSGGGSRGGLVNNGGLIQYQVQPGQRGSDIAAMYGLSLDQLAQANPGLRTSDGYLNLVEGNNIWIPRTQGLVNPGTRPTLVPQLWTRVPMQVTTPPVPGFGQLQFSMVAGVQIPTNTYVIRNGSAYVAPDAMFDYNPSAPGTDFDPPGHLINPNYVQIRYVAGAQIPVRTGSYGSQMVAGAPGRLGNLGDSCSDDSDCSGGASCILGFCGPDLTSGSTPTATTSSTDTGSGGATPVAPATTGLDGVNCALTGGTWDDTAKICTCGGGRITSGDGCVTPTGTPATPWNKGDTCGANAKIGADLNCYCNSGYAWASPTGTDCVAQTGGGGGTVASKAPPVISTPPGGTTTSITASGVPMWMKVVGGVLLVGAVGGGAYAITKSSKKSGPKTATEKSKAKKR